LKPISPSDKEIFTEKRIYHWDSIAEQMNNSYSWGGYYHKRLEALYKFLIPPGQRILEIGCCQGDLLAAMQPGMGVGIDISQGMVQRAQSRHPELTFLQADAHQINIQEKFDVIILSDVINEFWDIQTVLQQLSPLCSSHTRIFFNFYNRLWQPILSLAQNLKLATKLMLQNWLTPNDLINLLYLENFEVIRTWQEILFPLPIPLVSPLLNRFLVKFWPFNLAALTNFIVARPIPKIDEDVTTPSVSIIVPARNEAGNIPNIFERIPKMGTGTELIFVEGHSRDNTLEVIKKKITAYPEQNAHWYTQGGEGKGDAVRQGFSHACGDILMILDADLTVSPEDLLRFYEALVSGKGELINGVRLVYPMEKEAMRLFNFLGNKFFSLAFSWLLGQPIKDTLCGTKVLWKKDYDLIEKNRSYFGNFDPFGDFDLLFGSAKLNKKIIDIPVRYHERVYGSTNIQRWKHGVLLLRMVLFAAMRLKFI
jgi:2-polyprenyl-3-methyl-5-hydroxy-6-metoxy-1,4-benzoquinol methylase